jgi:hypothetical protein
LHDNKARSRKILFVCGHHSSSFHLFIYVAMSTCRNDELPVSKQRPMSSFEFFALIIKFGMKFAYMKSHTHTQWCYKLNNCHHPAIWKVFYCVTLNGFSQSVDAKIFFFFPHLLFMDIGGRLVALVTALQLHVRTIMLILRTELME